MLIVWDEAKRIVDIDKHSLDFADILEFEWENAAIFSAQESTGGQSRLNAIGTFRNGTTAVIFATLGTEAVSIISFRIASQKERRYFYENAQNTD